jgi:hypothetical protein
MGSPKRLDVSWNGQPAGVLEDVEDQTALVPLVQPDGDLPGYGRPTEAKFSGRWIPADTAAGSDFMANLKVNYRPEVAVLPYSTCMKVVFSLAPDGTGWLHCRARR